MKRRDILRLGAGAYVALAATALGAPCAVRRVAETGLADIGGYLAVPAAIDGQPVSLLLDTGAEAGLLTPEAAERLRLRADPKRFSLVQGTGGDGGMSPHALVRWLQLGALAVSGLSLPLGPLPSFPRLDPPVAGLLGADLLSRFDVELDIRASRLALYQVEADPGCEGGLPVGWSGPVQAVPLHRSGERLTLEVEVNGRRMTALIDTGARSIILSTKAASRLGIGAAELARDPGGISSGVDMREVSFHWHRFDTLRIGSETIRRPVLTVAPFQEEADMLLGSAFFATRRVWLSYATERMFVQS